MPRYRGPRRYYGPLQPYGVGRGCSKFGCPWTARRSGYCVFHDPRATPEEVDAAEKALERPRRRWR